jgi:hypothetical protein
MSTTPGPQESAKFELVLSSRDANLIINIVKEALFVSLGSAVSVRQIAGYPC